MDSGPRELSLAEIRSFMLKNNCKVTNHALVKHFRAFLTNKETQGKYDSLWYLCFRMAPYHLLRRGVNSLGLANFDADVTWYWVDNGS